MATENTVMAAVLTPGETVIGNAACEPHIQDLCRFLVTLGARIEGIESNVLRIQGVDSLSGGEWRIGPEHIEVGSFIGLAAVTGGDVTIDGRRAAETSPRSCRSSSGSASTSRSRGRACACRPARSSSSSDDLGGQIPKIEDGPWPAFPADLTSIAVIVATQARGTVLIFEKMFESRLFFVDKLVSMGARIILCDPHRAVVTGPAKLYGQQMSSPDIRAGMAMLLAALCAEGTSTIGEHRRDRPRLRAHRRAAALARRPDRARRGLVAGGWVRRTRPGSCTRASTSPAAARRTSRPGCRCSTTCWRCSPQYASFDLALEIAPGRRRGRGRGGRPRARRRRSRRRSSARACAGTARRSSPPTRRSRTSWSRPRAGRSSSRTSTSATRGSPASRSDIVATFLRRARRGRAG